MSTVRLATTQEEEGYSGYTSSVNPDCKKDLVMDAAWANTGENRRGIEERGSAKKKTPH